ncbi:MAG: type II pantothenate kinase [Prevotella sp.]|nr:type II pantothenate kinase [Prevotella sp.]
MKTVIGIDVGISTTKIVGFSGGKIQSSIRITAVDPITSLYGAFGKYLYNNNLTLEDIEHVMLTGVGAAYVKDNIYGLPTTKVGEFDANGLGAIYETGLKRAVIVSMGTGTSFVKYDHGAVSHIGGIGVGGGTLQGLSRLLLNTSNINEVSDLGLNGDISKINLLIGDISAEPLPGLPMDATASLFGNAMNNAAQEDVAKGIVWLVLQSACSAAVLAGLGTGIRDFIMIGNLTMLPLTNEIFPMVEKLYNVRFIVPDHAEFCTALGAALKYVMEIKGNKGELKGDRGS